MADMTILGLDLGTARIGVAIGTTELRFASPWGIVAAHPEETAFSTLRDLIKREGVSQLVIGLPRLLQHPDQETAQQETIRAWVKRFQDTCSTPVIFEDETLSTALAARWQHELEQKGKRDDLAALAILQTYLDRYEHVSS